MEILRKITATVILLPFAFWLFWVVLEGFMTGKLLIRSHARSRRKYYSKRKEPVRFYFTAAFFTAVIVVILIGWSAAMNK